MTNPFFANKPAKPHLVRPGGLKGEIFNLYKKLERAFDLVATAISAGAPGDVPRTIEHTFTSADFPGSFSPAAIIPPGARIRTVDVAVANVFGADNQLQIGTGGTPDFLLGVIDTILQNPTVQGGEALFLWPGGPVVLTFLGSDPGAPGSATVLITYIPSPQV